MNKILLMLENRGNRNLLAKWLRESYEIFEDNDQLLSGNFDLCILDGPVLDRLGEKIVERKQAESPLFLPFLIITTLHGVGLVTRHLWKKIDELVIVPIQKTELQARVEVLLRARRQSIQVSVLNKQMLEDTRLRLQLAVKGADIGLWDWDLSSGKVYYSTEWKQQIGYEDQEVSDDLMEWESRVHPDDLERMKSVIESYLSKPWPDYCEEFRFRHRNGSYLWIMVKASLVYDIQGRPLRMLGCHIDITDRKKTEEKLRYKEYLLSVSQDIAHIGSWDADWIGGEFVWTNEMYSICGVSPETFKTTPKNFIRLISPDDRPGFQLWSENINSGINPGALDFRIVPPDGSVKWVRVKGEIFFDQNGNPVRVIGTLLDITDIKKATEAVRASEERLRRFLESFGGMAYQIDISTQKMTFLFGNSEVLTGYSLRDFFTGSLEWEECIFSEDLKKIVGERGNLLAKNVSVAVMDYRVVNRDGTVKWVRDTGWLSKNGYDSMLLNGIIIDITDWHVLEEKLQENMVELAKVNDKLRKIDQIKTEFVYTASHEIRTPLTSILGFSQTLLSSDIEIPSETRLKYLHIIESEAKRLSRLVESLLDISRIETGRIELSFKPISIYDLVKNVLQSIYIPEALKVEIEISDKNLQVFGDPQRLEQVLRNLLDNAFRYSRPETKVTIVISKSDGEVIIAIKDTGPGIPESEYNQVFEKFYRIKGEMIPSKGSGLGLAIAKEIVEAHHGKIWVESQEGKGSTFYIVLHEGKSKENNPQAI